MERDNQIIAACALTIAVLVKKKKQKLKKKKCIKRKLWSHKCLLRRDEDFGYASMVLKEFQIEDPGAFKNFMRMSIDTFTELRNKVCPLLIKNDTVMRKALSPELKLMCTLRFLATGQNYQELAYGFRVSVAAISLFVPEVLASIIKVLDEFFKVPESVHEWENIAEDFERQWNFPNCLGAIDGKHIAIRAKKKDGSYFYNYKGFNSIILLAVVDANYKFVYACIGGNGRGNDAAIFNDSYLGLAIKNSTLQFPSDKELPGTNTKVPYVFVGDEAFRLTDRIMKPNSNRKVVENRIFNYRLSRARRVVENAFGILVTKFRIFQKEINLLVDKVEQIVLDACALHNFIRTRDGTNKSLLDNENTNSITLTEGTWRNQVYITDLERAPGNRTGENCRGIREHFTQYFNNIGSVPWQMEAINKFNF